MNLYKIKDIKEFKTIVFALSNNSSKKEYCFAKNDFTLENFKNALEIDILVSYLDKNLQNLLSNVLNLCTDDFLNKMLDENNFEINNIRFEFSKFYPIGFYTDNRKEITN